MLKALAPVLASLTLISACHPSTDATKAPDTTPIDSADSTDTGEVDDTAPPDTGEPLDSGDTGEPTPEDADGDGYDASIDCDDDNDTVYPGAREICSDGVANDCDSDTGTALERCTSPVSTADARVTWQLGYASSERVKATGVGDLNGDGLDDVVLGHPILDKWTDGGEFEASDVGGAYVYYAPFEGDYAWGDEDQAIVGTTELARLGWDVVGMGDVDGDGYADFAMASAENFGAGPTVYRVDGPAQIVSASEATVLVTTTSTNNCAGASLTPTTDRDGDGQADLLVGDLCAAEVHLISGGVTEPGELGTDDLATFVGAYEDSRFGHAMAEGDFDGDGLGDIAIGAPEMAIDTPDPTGHGYVTVFSGDVTGSLTEADADSAIRATASDSVPSDSGNTLVLLGTAVSASDLNGDGYDDLVAGAPARNDDTMSGSSWLGKEGALLVYHGPLPSEAGIPDADFALTGAQRNPTVGGETTADQDLDGDGHPDLLIGNGWVEWDGSSLSSAAGGFGSAWIVLGPISTGTRSAADADVILREDAGVTELVWGSLARVAGDTDGDGRKEVLVSDYGSWIGLFDLPTDAY